MEIVSLAFPRVSDMCMPCMNSKEDEVLSKLFYGGLELPL